MAKLFALGQTFVTAGIDHKMEKDFDFKLFVYQSLGRYIHEDWGDLCDEDKQMNNDAVKNGERILAVYKRPSTDETIWIITEWDRSVTTILLPSEY